MVRSTCCVVLLLLLSVAARSASAIMDGLLPNGNFEEAPDKSQLNGTRVIGRYAIPQWEISGFVEYIGSGQMQGDMLLPVPEGAYAVRLGNEASIQQRLTLTRGMHYSVTFSAARTCAQSELLNITVTPEIGEVPIQTVYTSSGWDSYSWAFKARRSDVSLIVHNPGVTDDAACGPLIDSFAIKTLQSPPSTKGGVHVPGRSYRLEFSVGDAGDGCVGSMSVQAYVSHGSVKVPYESQGRGGYKRGVLEFTATDKRTRVVFVSMAYTMKPDGTLCGPVVDDASVVGVHSHRRLLL
ncbi:hypothetical protein OsJ_15311 [Oryza sativa Japonica Group]|uniref:DUF642 domain-containing protein n=1 Tax=Oryza sativa subsp. japonica TaxID=39947 RepID=A3AV72_ORYSJ|nr:hypothetical protein OsJ_15311 [Oryza sativa Japonica Group]